MEEKNLLTLLQERVELDSIDSEIKQKKNRIKRSMKSNELTSEEIQKIEKELESEIKEYKLKDKENKAQIDKLQSEYLSQGLRGLDEYLQNFEQVELSIQFKNEYVLTSEIKHILIKKMKTKFVDTYTIIKRIRKLLPNTSLTYITLNPKEIINGRKEDKKQTFLKPFDRNLVYQILQTYFENGEYENAAKLIFEIMTFNENSYSRTSLKEFGIPKQVKDQCIKYLNNESIFKIYLELLTGKEAATSIDLSLINISLRNQLNEEKAIIEFKEKSIVDLQKTIKELEKQIENQKELLEKREKDIKDKENNLLQYTDAVGLIENKYLNLQNELNVQNTMLIEQNRVLQDKVTSLESSNEEKSIQIISLTSEKLLFAERNKELNIYNQNLESDLAVKQKKIDDLQKSIAETKSDENEKVFSRIAESIYKQIMANNRTIEVFEKEIGSPSKKISTRYTAIKRASKELEELMNEFNIYFIGEINQETVYDSSIHEPKGGEDISDGEIVKISKVGMKNIKTNEVLKKAIVGKEI